MSGVVSEPSTSDEQKLTTSRNGDTVYRGQRHDRIQDTSGQPNPVTMDESNEPEVEDIETDISAVQKMLSAVSGSLLTSLLGILLFPHIFSSKPILTSTSHPIRRCPSPSPITTSTPIHKPSVHLVLHQSTQEYRRNGLLPRSLLGR